MSPSQKLDLEEVTQYIKKFEFLKIWLMENINLFREETKNLQNSKGLHSYKDIAYLFVFFVFFYPVYFTFL